MTVARRLVGFNLLTACLLGIGGWYVGWFAAHAVVGPSIAFFGDQGGPGRRLPASATRIGQR